MILFFIARGESLFFQHFFDKFPFSSSPDPSFFLASSSAFIYTCSCVSYFPPDSRFFARLLPGIRFPFRPAACISLFLSVYYLHSDGCAH